MNPAYLSIIIPTYNERDNVRPLVRRLAEALPERSWEVLFVDDNSVDGTADEALQLSHEDPRVRMILRLSDRGLARSTIQGMLSAKGSLLCVMDGDGQHDPRVIPEMLARLEAERLDIISAARKLADTPSQALSKERVTLSRLGNWLGGLMLGRPLTDPLTGFFIVRRDAFLRVAPKLRDPGFKLLLDILHGERSLKHAEHPFDFGTRQSGESKLDSFVAWQFLTFLLSKATGSIIPADLVSFLLVGATGLVVHLVALYTALLAGTSFEAAQLIAALIAASSNFMLNNFLTFRDRRLRGMARVAGYLKFLAVSSVGLAANVSVAALTYQRLGHVVLLATLAGVAIDTLWKFVISRRIIWR